MLSEEEGIDFELGDDVEEDTRSAAEGETETESVELKGSECDEQVGIGDMAGLNMKKKKKKKFQKKRDWNKKQVSFGGGVLKSVDSLEMCNNPSDKSFKSFDVALEIKQKIQHNET